MNNAWLLFKSDLKRLRRNVVTIIIVVGLVVLPSLFSWYNVLACWNVFDNTGNLMVAVANSDEGYQSDLVPLRINIGDDVVSALRANDELNWVITDEEDAIDGARSGRYYAAVVIPSSFSADMMSFYSNDVEHAKITYYSNLKKSAIAPKVTDKGADQVSRQVNTIFAETISNVTLSIAAALYDYADDADADGAIGKLAAHMASISSQMNEAADALVAYSSVLESAENLVDESASLLAGTQRSANEVAEAVQGAQDSTSSIVSAISQSASALATAVENSAAEFSDAASAVSDAFDRSDAAAQQASSLLREQASSAEQAGDPDRAAALREAADAIDDANEKAQSKRLEAEQLTSDARSNLDDVRNDYTENVKPTLDALAASAADASGQVSAIAAQLDSVSGELGGTADSITEKMTGSREKLGDAASDLTASAQELADLSTGIQDALKSNDLEALRKVIGGDPSALASAIAAPVELERHAVYPVDNFGSAMSPLYTTLALWIGALIMMVTLNLIPTAEMLQELDDPSPRQMFVGRFGVVALISLAQSTFMSLGNLLFLGVQAEHPLLYVLCFWVSGLAFAFIIYTLVALFANLGKALSVILLIVQVSGGGGAFPLKLLPESFQNLSPYLPITHAVNAMRAAMFGIYQADFWIELGTLALFTVPLMLLGLVLHKPLMKVVPQFIARVEKSKLM